CVRRGRQRNMERLNCQRTNQATRLYTNVYICPDPSFKKETGKNERIRLSDEPASVPNVATSRRRLPFLIRCRRPVACELARVTCGQIRPYRDLRDLAARLLFRSRVARA